MILVAVLGAAGRMGATVCAAVDGADDMTLTSRIDTTTHDDVSVAISQLPASGATVAVDFTHPDATEGNVHALLDAGLHVVVGTTGWTDTKLAGVREHAERAERGVIIAPNFAIGAILAMRFAATAARYFASAEVIELHHENKVDAPSGTARHTAAGIAAARTSSDLGPVPDATQHGWEARGADVDGIRVHSVRLPGLVAHEEILLGNPGEMLTIRHDSFDRASFMPGVLLAVRKVAQHPGLTVGLDKVMDW